MTLKSRIDRRLADLTVTEGFVQRLAASVRRPARLRLRPTLAALLACALFTLSVTALAHDAVRRQKGAFYLRYLSPETMAVADALAEREGPDLYLEGLRSDDPERQYFCAAKLPTLTLDEARRASALEDIALLMHSPDEKTANAAALALSLLTGTFDHPGIYALADGSVLFAPFPDYSDYGSHSQLWRMKDGVPELYYAFDRPSMYITSVTLSPDKTRAAVSTCSNKSSYLTVFSPFSGRVSPELVDSARAALAQARNIDLWMRIDGENYSGLELPVRWADNDTVVFSASLAYNGGEIVESAQVAFDIAAGSLTFAPDPERPE